MAKKKIGMVLTHTSFGNAQGIHKTPLIPWEEIDFIAPYKESRQIAGYKYDVGTSILYIKFHKGGIYAYKGITKEIYITLSQVDLSSESLGEWISKNITRNKDIEFEKLN